MIGKYRTYKWSIDWSDENQNILIIPCIHRNLILEDIYDAAWCNKDSSGLISVIYYGDGEGEVDERPAAEFIMLKMHNLIRTATENEPL